MQWSYIEKVLVPKRNQKFVFVLCSLRNGKQFPPSLKYLINHCRIENLVTFNLVRRWAKATISVIFGLGVFKARNNLRNLSALLIKLEIYLNKLSNIKWSEQIRMLFICWWSQSNHTGTESAKNSSLYY